MAECMWDELQADLARAKGRTPSSQPCHMDCEPSGVAIPRAEFFPTLVGKEYPLCFMHLSMWEN